MDLDRRQQIESETTLKAPTPESRRWWAWWHVVSYVYLALLIPLSFLESVGSTFLIWMFPIIAWGVLVSIRLDGAYYRKNLTPERTYRAAYFGRTWSILFFAILGAGTVFANARFDLHKIPFGGLGNTFDDDRRRTRRVGICSGDMQKASSAI